LPQDSTDPSHYFLAADTKDNHLAWAWTRPGVNDESQHRLTREIRETAIVNRSDPLRCREVLTEPPAPAAA
jgi:hypothetical protein